ncbi:uncharacterized protein OCT59_000215 [Rhizophagus irregularis]|uniref:uncharacterized protein n=1 Tax=Rhizophagus irregularis TaxID=588596 RepID=UPI003325F73A|nr:hypothetical protein OCT59_000215 [Rhizophagus irregularis]
MACSKIFSGDLPELSYEIIQYFRKDISTLYSCILVNRLWCRLAIPLIWEDPFSLLTQNSRYINTYLCFLNEDGKARFNEYGINDNLLLLNTSFNYPRFIKYLDTFKISNSVEDWVITLNTFLILKNSNCSNTLNTIIFYFINFKNIIDSDFVQQIFKVIKPFKLRSLFMKETIPNDHIESLLLLLQKFSDCLENFGFESGEIGQNQHNINYLTIEADITSYYDYGELSSTVLQNLGQVLPSRLEYLCLALSFITSDLEIFLNNSQNTFIKKLLISNKFQYTPLRKEDTEILFFIKKYIMKKERVKYLAIVESDSNASTEPVELFFLKNEVNEYKLNNIIVQKYNDLYIDAHSYINNHLQY